MNNPLIAILSVACLALSGSGCATNGPRNKKEKPKREEPRPEERGQVVLLPRQTGSHLERRVVVDDESSLRPLVEPESTPSPKKKQAKTERTKPKDTEPEKRDEPEKPKKVEKPEEPPMEPDRFR